MNSQVARCLVWSLNPIHLARHLSMPVCHLCRFDWAGVLNCSFSLNNSIRFRKAWKVQGHSVEELPFQAMGGVWGSWLGVILIVLVLIAQFYVVSDNIDLKITLTHHVRFI